MDLLTHWQIIIEFIHLCLESGAGLEGRMREHVYTWCQAGEVCIVMIGGSATEVALGVLCMGGKLLTNEGRVGVWVWDNGRWQGVVNRVHGRVCRVVAVEIRATNVCTPVWWSFNGLVITPPFVAAPFKQNFVVGILTPSNAIFLILHSANT